MEDVTRAAEKVRELRARRGWSAAEAARRVVALSVALDRPIDLSQQAVSKFETGKGKSVPAWVRLLEMAVEFDELKPEERFRYINVRQGSGPTLPVEERFQFASLFVAIPSEHLLTQMFEVMFRSMPSVEPSELPRELAKLLPTALEQLKWSALEWRAATDEQIAERRTAARPGIFEWQPTARTR